MPHDPTTPPSSKDTNTGSTLSKTTPLKRDLSGSQSHSSTPQLKASTRYKEMTVDASEKFVGPMPVDLFLSDFVSKAHTERPMNEFVFAHSSVSQKEDEFVRVSQPQTRSTAYAYSRYVLSRHLVYVPDSNSSTQPLNKTAPSV